MNDIILIIVFNIFACRCGCIAQLAEHWIPNPKVAGSAAFTNDMFLHFVFFTVLIESYNVRHVRLFLGLGYA